MKEKREEMRLEVTVGRADSQPIGDVIVDRSCRPVPATRMDMRNSNDDD